jgi:chemotaxis protein methyltransferase CheR
VEQPGQTEVPSLTRSISDQEFSSLARLIFREAGIKLTDSKRPLLVGRLGKRLRSLGCESFAEYYRYVSSGHQDELQQMIDCICTNETQFFREPQHFELLTNEILPSWERQAAAGERARQIRAWSAGCSTGEEPYSLAMILRDRFPPGCGWMIEILASDISQTALATARRGVWPIQQARDIPERLLKLFMFQGTRSQRGQMAAGPEIRSMVRFTQLNLNSHYYQLKGRFDLIFCRNVLIYFDDETKQQIVDRLLRHLAPGGLFFVGHSEGLYGSKAGIKRVTTTVYSHADTSEASGGGQP